MNLFAYALVIAALFAPPAFAKEAALAVPHESFSELESVYSSRADQKLKQFGYDLFGIPGPETRKRLDSLANAAARMEAAPDEFVLHAGDELDVTLEGRRDIPRFYKINAFGLLAVPGLPPVPAEGRTVGQVRVSVMAAARSLHKTDARVSLSSVREINVSVTGHVRRAGTQSLTVSHTVIDALIQAGGVGKDGSLRGIKLLRGDGGENVIDLYALLMNGSAMDLQLRDGDRIIVPPIGPVMGIAGGVTRPGIYELLPGETITLQQALDLSGGLLAPGRSRFLELGEGHGMVTEIHDSAIPSLGGGAVLMVTTNREAGAGTVEITSNNPSRSLP